jgi:hypothetical protein
MAFVMLATIGKPSNGGHMGKILSWEVSDDFWEGCIRSF